MFLLPSSLGGQTYQGAWRTRCYNGARCRSRPACAGDRHRWRQFSDAVDNAPDRRPGAAAIAEYRKMLQVDVERGPLPHARQIMQRSVISAAADDVAKAWRLLVSHRIHQAPVLDAERQLVGIVSERDLLTALNVDGGIRDALARKVADVMTTPVVAADPLTDLRRVARVMLEHDVDGVPIVDETAGWPASFRARRRAARRGRGTAAEFVAETDDNRRERYVVSRQHQPESSPVSGVKPYSAVFGAIITACRQFRDPP